MFRVKKRRRGKAVVDPKQRSSLLWYKLIRYVGRLLGRRRIYLIGDTHFDHGNIIKYAQRPFRNVRDMNKKMRRKWNETVRARDTVYFLGDYTGPPPRRLGLYYKKLRRWTGQLKGFKTSILGNHDRNGGCVKFEKNKLLSIGKYTFLLIHDPKDAEAIKTVKEKYDWIIHGHVHNNEMNKYPFINGIRKTINVSVELIGYKPVSLDYLVSLGLDSIKRMDTFDSKPERK